MPVFPSRRFTTRNVLRAAVGCAVVAILALNAAPVRAADADEDDGFDSRIIRYILKGVGLRDDTANIDYHERSPLVIPPSRKLPAPEAAASANPNWPVEPEIKRKREEAANKTANGKSGDPVLDEGRALRPEELNRGPRTARNTGPGTPEWDGRRLSQKELGYKKGFFGMFESSDNETVKFSGEPARSSLTEPPTGYQTPSPSQPYGVGKERGGQAAPRNIYEDRSEAR